MYAVKFALKIRTPNQHLVQGTIDMNDNFSIAISLVLNNGIEIFPTRMKRQSTGQHAMMQSTIGGEDEAL